MRMKSEMLLGMQSRMQSKMLSEMVFRSFQYLQIQSLKLRIPLYRNQIYREIVKNRFCICTEIHRENRPY